MGNAMEVGENKFTKTIEEQNILRFADAVDNDESLEFLGDGISTNAEIVADSQSQKMYQIDTLFVLEDKRFNYQDSVAFPKMDIKEVMEKCTTEKRASQLMEMLKGNANTTVLVGVTRIVGYYSRVNSWNKSKIGELRDRGYGNYWANKEEHTVNKERQKAVDAL